MSDNENKINIEPNDIENPRIKRERRAHSPERGSWGQFVAISPEEQPKPKNFPRKPSRRLGRVLDLETGDSKEDFNVNTPPQNLYHTGPVPDPLPTDEDLEQALKEGVNIVKDSICNTVSGCQLQGGRKRKRRTRKKNGGRFEKLALKIDEFNKRIADLEYINEDTASLIQNINNDIEGYGRDIELNSTAIDNISARLQRLEDGILNMETSERKEERESKAYMGGRKRRKKKKRKTRRKKKRTKKGGNYEWVNYQTFYNYLERLDSAALKVNPEDTDNSLGGDYTYKYINNGQEQTKILGYKEARNDNTYRFDFWLNDNLTRTFDSRTGEDVVFKIPSHESPQPGGGKRKRKTKKRRKKRRKRKTKKR